MVDMTLIRPLNKDQSHYWVIIHFGSNFLEISCDFTDLGRKTVFTWRFLRCPGRHHQTQS